jgi:hypothetical protein
MAFSLGNFLRRLLCHDGSVEFSGGHFGRLSGMPFRHTAHVRSTTKSAEPRFCLRKKCGKLEMVQHYPKSLLEEDAIV